MTAQWRRGDPGLPGLVTTDRVGNRTQLVPGSRGSHERGLPGGIAPVQRHLGISPRSPGGALLLSANPELAWWGCRRSSRSPPAKPTSPIPILHTNAAGFHQPQHGFRSSGRRRRGTTGPSWTGQSHRSKFAKRSIASAPFPTGLRVGARRCALRVLGFRDPGRAARAGCRPIEHPRARDIEVRVTSPAEPSASCCARVCGEPVPTDWTFHSVLHLGESSRGTWRVDFFDHRSGVTGHVNAVELIPDRQEDREDTDADGLDDRWEEASSHTRSFGPADDPDHDGLEQCRRTDGGNGPRRPGNRPPPPTFSSPGQGSAPGFRGPTGLKFFEIWGPQQASPSPVSPMPPDLPDPSGFSPAWSPDTCFQVRTITNEFFPLTSLLWGRKEFTHSKIPGTPPRTARTVPMVQHLSRIRRITFPKIILLRVLLNHARCCTWRPGSPSLAGSWVIHWRGMPLASQLKKVARPPPVPSTLKRLALSTRSCSWTSDGGNPVRCRIPLVPSKSSRHQPSRMERFRQPWGVVFMPLVPEASQRAAGLFSQMSHPDTILRQTWMS